MRSSRIIIPIFCAAILTITTALPAHSQAPAYSAASAVLEGGKVFHDGNVTDHLKEKGGLTFTTLAGGEMSSIIVQLEDPPLAAYEGSIPGLAGTSPRVTGESKVNMNSKESRAYLTYLNQRQEAFIAAVRRSIPGARSVNRYEFVLGGVSIIVPASDAHKVAALPGVKRVFPDRWRKPLTEVSPDFIGAPDFWNRLGGPGQAGEGVIVGVIDTGIWPEHPSFSDDGSFPAPPPTWAGTSCTFGSAVPGDAAFSCNNKLIGASRHMASYDSIIPLLPTEFPTSRDDDGHGTHTASTAAGNSGVGASIFGFPRGTVSGIAPRAHVVAYKALGNLGGTTSDLVAAINQAVADGVDVINYSIGGGASDPYTDADSLAFLDAYGAKVFAATSAGNSGPNAGTLGSPGNAPWITTVGASTSDRHFSSTITLTSATAPSLNLTGFSITNAIATPTPVIFPPAGSELCLNPFAPGTFSGEIVICNRGLIARIAKSFNCQSGGAGGMFLVNTAVASVNTDNHFIPTVHLDDILGQQLTDYVSANTAVMATFTAGGATPVTGDVMAAFSSRGGPEMGLDVIKPDVTAPGVQILAGHSPLPATIGGGPTGELFQAIAGTSMSSPHTAGAGALLRDLYPRWSAGKIRSALMTSAVPFPEVLKEDGVTPSDPFDSGAGRINLSRAFNPGLTFSATRQQYLDNEMTPWKINLPSIYLSAVPGKVVVKRTAHGEMRARSSWRSIVTAPADVTVRVIPRIITLRGRRNRTFKIIVDARDVPVGEVRHGYITLKGLKRHRRLSAILPFTLIRRQAAVTLEKSCSPGTLPLGDSTDCTITMVNTGLVDAHVILNDKLPGKLKIIPASISGAKRKKNGLRFAGTLPASIPPQVSAGIDPAASPAGYTSLAAFGGTQTVVTSDDSIQNWTVPSFDFAGETHTVIGISSNGYIVVGGGGQPEVTAMNTNLPDPTAPNNLLAPFFTDLNPSAGGRVLINALTNGIDSWTVVEWESVRNFADTATNTFQVWISYSRPDDISFVYGSDVSAGSGGFLTVGAENRFGTSGAAVYYNGAGTAPGPSTGGYEVDVTSSPGIPGPPYQVSFSARGRRLGNWKNCAVLKSTAFFGTAIDCDMGTVIP